MERVLMLTADAGEELEAFDNDLPVGQPDIAAAGDEFVEGADVVDGQMVSATGWTDLAEWSRAFMHVLEGAPVAGVR